MLGLRLFAAVLIAAAVGCVEPPPPADPWPFIDDTPAAPVTPDQRTPDNCPDGVCPPRRDGDTLGREVGGRPTAVVNLVALDEPKSDCPPCNVAKQPPSQTVARSPVITRPASSPVVGPPIRLRPGEVLLHVGPPRVVRPVVSGSINKPMPQTPTVAPPVVQASDTPREGVFVCQRCGKAVVGKEWHELWADDDTPLTCLCKTCWATLSPEDREAELMRYARGSRGDAAYVSPVVVEAIKEASQR
jgi:hypothetical protein